MLSKRTAESSGELRADDDGIRPTSTIRDRDGSSVAGRLGSPRETQATPLPGQTPDGPWVLTCHGDVAITHWLLAVAPGTPGANPGGGNIMVTRTKGLQPVNYAAPTDRWLEASVNGVPVALA
jgi:hypothetical protein